MARHRVGRLILLVVLIVGVDDACGNPLAGWNWDGMTYQPTFNVAGNWNYATDTLVDDSAQMQCVVTTPMDFAMVDSIVTGTFRGMLVSCHSPSGPVVLHRDGNVVAVTVNQGTVNFDFDSTAFNNQGNAIDATHLSGVVQLSVSVNSKPFVASGNWTATKR